MTDNTSKSKRIAKNTVMLYVRSLIVMIISLYTSRVILHALGVEDYGLYNVIGGVVGLFAFLRTSMTKSTQRFLNVEMAKPDGRLSETFRVSFSIHFVISLVALLLAETLGLWFLNNYIQIPEGREFAANIVYQSTVFSLVFTILSVPFNACIIAHEKMGYFAAVSIADSILKLLICYLIMIDGMDRLILYGWLMMLINLINFFLYAIYCLSKYSETSFQFLFHKGLVKEMLGYTTWTLLGQIAIIGTNQGNNVLVNMFHSVTANASMGIAHQINSAIVSLTSNFQTAFNPQITKSYAARDYDYLRFLVYSTSKISYFLLFFVSIPIIFNIGDILNIWLTKAPLYADEFCVLIIINSILNALSAPLNFSVLSSGNIKWFQIVTSIVYLSDLFFVYIFFSLGFPPVYALYVKVSIMVVILFVRLNFAHKIVASIDYYSYFKVVLKRIAIVTVLSVIIGIISLNILADIPYGGVLSTAVLVTTNVFLILYIGLTTSERNMLFNIFKGKLKKSK